MDEVIHPKSHSWQRALLDFEPILCWRGPHSFYFTVWSF